MTRTVTQNGTLPSPLRRSSRGVYVEDLHTVAVTLRTIGDAVPVFGGVLKAAAGLAVSILDASERVSMAQEMCKNLAARAAQLVIVLLQEATTGHISEDTLDSRLEPLTAILKDALCAVEALTDGLKVRRFSRLRRAWRIREIEDILNAHTIRINNATEQFNVATLIDLRKLQGRISEHLGALVQANATISTPHQIMLGINVHSTAEPQIEEFRRIDIQLLEPLASRSSGAHLYRGRACSQGGRIFPVLVKQYDRANTPQLTEDLRFLSRFMHSNLPMVVGRSPLLESLPYLLVTPVAMRTDSGRCAKAYISQEVRGDPVGGFMSMLVMMRDIVSALRYLCGTLKLSKSDLEVCANPSRFGMTAHGRVLIGQDLLVSNSLTNEVLLSAGDPKKWLLGQCWRIAVDLSYGATDSIKWDQWDSTQTERPHLRLLLNLSNFICPSLDVLDATFCALAEELNPKYTAGVLTFSQIRKATLKIAYYVPSYRYLPKHRLCATIGDIGYIRGGMFVKLDSMAEYFHGGTGCLPDYTATSGAVVSDIMGDGTIRHRIMTPNYVNLKRWGASEVVHNPGQYWQTFSQKACKLVAEAGGNRDFNRADLILVTAIADSCRISIYCFDTQGHAQVQPPDVTIIEKLDDLHTIEWLYDMTGYEESQFSVTEACSSFFCYMQMEEIEYDEMLEREERGRDEPRNYGTSCLTLPTVISESKGAPQLPVRGDSLFSRPSTHPFDDDIQPTPDSASDLITTNIQMPDTSDANLYHVESRAAINEGTEWSDISYILSRCLHAATKEKYPHLSVASSLLLLLFVYIVVFSSFVCLMPTKRVEDNGTEL